MNFSADNPPQLGETVGRMGIAGLRPLTAEERAVLADYEREMTEHGIPEIIKAVRRREQLAHESRQRWMG